MNERTVRPGSIEHVELHDASLRSLLYSAAGTVRAEFETIGIYLRYSATDINFELYAAALTMFDPENISIDSISGSDSDWVMDAVAMAGARDISFKELLVRTTLNEIRIGCNGGMRIVVRCKEAQMEILGTPLAVEPWHGDLSRFESL